MGSERDAKFRFRHWTSGFTKALILENPDPSLDDLLRKQGIEPDRAPELRSEAELAARLKAGGHNLIFKRSRVEISEAVVQACPNLAAVMLCCIGDDSVDKEACAKHGVLVMNDPVSNGRSVAELVIGEIIALSRRLFDSVVEMSTSVWKKNNVQRYELMNKKLGILGLGKIGRQVAQLGQSFGMSIFFYDTDELAREVGLAMGWTECDSLNDLFAAADYLTVHLSADDARGEANTNLITYDLLKMLAQKDYESPRVFVNASRGIVVAPDALKRAVADGHVNYAITDVFPDEPHHADDSWVNPYSGEPRIFSTPHIGAATREAQPRIARYVAKTTQLFNELGMVRNCVFRPRAKIHFPLDYASAMLAVVHVDKRGTKKAVDDAIFNAGVNNLQSAHIDFPDVGIAYDLSALDQAISPETVSKLVSHACELTGDPTAVRWLRVIPLEK